MRLFFLIPLTTGIIFSYISYCSSEDITYISGVIAAVSLLLSLIVAPWQLQLMLLLLIFFAVSLYWQRLKNREQIEIIEQQKHYNSENPVHNISSGNKEHTSLEVRKYRGITYETTNNEKREENENELEGKYRGIPVKIQHCPQMQPASTQFELKYRGISVITQDSKS